MKVLILGFDDYQELDRTMNKLIEENQCYLFNVICGGVSSVQRQISLSEQWARKNGAPVLYYYYEDFNKLLYFLEKDADYLVLKISESTPAWQKNLMMKFKAAGKHGTVVRG